MKTRNIWKLACLGALVFTACQDEEPADDSNNTSPIVGYVVNEGGFMNNNASISEVREDGTVNNNIFYSANETELGDVANSMAIVGTKGFVIVNNSQKIEVVDLEDFSSVATVTGLSYPRHGLNVNGTLLVTNGSFAGMVYELDPASNTLTDSVVVGNGPENLILNGTDVLVANSGGWTSDSTVSIINSSSLTVTQTITVGDNPSDIVKDANGNIWVLCKGAVEYDGSWNVIGGTTPKLVKLSGTDYSIISEVELGDYTASISKMAISADGQTIYYINGQVYKFSIDATQAETVAFISESAYGVDVNDNGDVVCLLAGDFSSNGTMKVYDSQGNLVSSDEVGVVPNSYLVK